MFQIDVVERCKANDRKAQLALYKQYCGGMFCVAMRFLKNKDDAEDVVKESFIKAYQRLDQFSGEVSFGAWLKKIVVNGCLDFIKTKKYEMVALEEGIVGMEDRDSGNWQVANGITPEMALKAIGELPEKYQFVVQLFLVEGYDHSEISQILGITEINSRTLLSRGRAQLKKRLNHLNYGTGS
ncbi:MAG: RNA polymerase sigma factor [Flavobacteriaceae bacterium]